jgi:RNA polymerase sigma factor (sigma-70 family)
MSQEVERPLEEVMLWFERAKQHRSLDILCHDDGSPLIQQIPDPSSYSDTEHMAITSANHSALNAALETLNDREYEIIQRYFLSNRTEALAHIGAEMNICRERTRQIKERALRKLRLKAQKEISPPG